jgi:hypothetical protein
MKILVIVIQVHKSVVDMINLLHLVIPAKLHQAQINVALKIQISRVVIIAK